MSLGLSGLPCRGTAPGTARQVTELYVGFSPNGDAVTADLQAFLYANDGPGGEPGTELWHSAVQSGVIIDRSQLLVEFSVPSVRVPDTFTWVAAVINQSRPTGVGFALSRNATTGTYIQGWSVAFGSGSWQTVNLPGTQQITSRVVAVVPEPSGLVLLGTGVLALLVWRCPVVRRCSARPPGVRG